MYSGGMTIESDILAARGAAIRARAADELAQLEREENRQAYLRLPAFLLAAGVVIYVGPAYLAPLVFMIVGWF
jgi:hypothetical protein